MDINRIHKIYFLGIGGIGMSALAKYFNKKGVEVFGYDRTPSPITDDLTSKGVNIHFDEDIKQIPSNIDLVVYTPAISSTNKELEYLKDASIPLKKRSQVLGMIAKKYFTIAIAGTHGKTSITSLVAHILKVSGKEVTAFMGGISKNYDTNLLVSEQNKLLIVEADEFDRSFLTLYPDIAVISSMDADHLDIYGNRENIKKAFMKFISQIKENGELIYKEGLYVPGDWRYKALSYSVDGSGIINAKDIKVKEGKYTFEVNGLLQMDAVSISLPGKYNIENTLAAIAVAHQIGCSHKQIKEALKSYKGVKRRFDTRIQGDKLVYIDDYAHHPEEIKACISAARDFYPGKEITGVFQPHLFSRTRDFADEFANSLEKLDRLILLDIYPAREEPIPGINSEMILEKVNIKEKILSTKEKLIENIQKFKPEVLITMGAGDIDRLVEPIEKHFKEK